MYRLATVSDNIFLAFSFGMKSFNKVLIASFIILIGVIFIATIKPSITTATINSSNLLTADILGDGTDLFVPVPVSLEFDADQVALGEKLFNDPMLGTSGFSCASCHQLDHAGIDGLPGSMTADGGFDGINTPSLFNSGLNSFQAWAGKFGDLESQLDGVINNPKHMKSNWPLVIRRLEKSSRYQPLFEQIFDGVITRQTVTIAVTSFERSLITPNSDFDKFLRGDRSALTSDQRRGYRLFIDYGCASCHQGINLGGNLLSRFGIYQNGLVDKAAMTSFDYGRFNFTGKEQDKFIFRVPSLRNVALTAPYFHNGKTPHLDDAIKLMAKVQLNVEMPDQEVVLIDAFLHSLSGEYRGRKL